MGVGMGEIYNKTYRSIGEATFGHKTLRQVRILSTTIDGFGLDTEFTLNDLTVDFTGFSRQTIRLTANAVGPPGTVEIFIEEFFEDPGGDPALGVWVKKESLGVAEVDYKKLFDHNGEDLIRKMRLILKYKTNLPDRDTFVEFIGRRFV